MARTHKPRATVPNSSQDSRKQVGVETAATLQKSIRSLAIVLFSKKISHDEASREGRINATPGHVYSIQFMARHIFVCPTPPRRDYGRVSDVPGTKHVIEDHEVVAPVRAPASAHDQLDQLRQHLQ